jgi:hypothetical protein
MMATIVLLVLALFLPASATHAQPTPVECPLPPYQMPLQAPERSVMDGSGTLIVDDAPVELPDGLTVRQHLWSDDGEVLLISATSPEFDSRVFAYRDGALSEILSADELLALRDDEFRDAVTIFDAVFIPGTHTVLFNTEILSDEEGIYVESPLDLWSLDLDTGELIEILPYGEAGEIHVAPDGSTLVLLGHDFIRQMDIDGGNPRTIFEGEVAVGMGHGAFYPDLIWDKVADTPTIRVLLNADRPDDSSIDVSFEVREFVLGEEVTSSVILSGPVTNFPAAYLSPDGYRVAVWSWQEGGSSNNPVFDVTVYQPDVEPFVLDSFEIVNKGGSAFIHWDDETHLTYGHIDLENTVIARRADLCSEITELEPYQSSMAEVLNR